ncbi:MAG: hypothetical protein ACR2HX_00225 [Pyrinomonadaceae bacterium]
MRVIDTKRIALLLGLVFFLCLPTEAQRRARAQRTATLQITDEDKRTIVSAVFADGLNELNAPLGGSSILDGCPDLILGDERVTFISTKNIDRKFVPQISGAHFEFMTLSEIDDAVKANDKHCYFEFTRFEVVGPKVAVTFGKYLKRPASIYGEAFKYEYTKVKGKWQGKYIGKTTP